MLSKEELKQYRAGWKKRRQTQEKKMKQKEESGRQKARLIARLLKEKYGAKRVILIGSLSKYSEHQVHQHSDIDLVFEADTEKYWEIFGEALDLAAPFAIDLIPLEEVSTTMKKRIKLAGEEL